MKHFAFLLLCTLLLTGCVSNKSIPTTQASDYTLTCEQLQDELTELGAKFEEAKDESGVTGENVALAVVFWPGVIFNEMRADKNQESVSQRIEHLGNLYNQKCVEK